jgi:hypothetical protein
VQWTFPVHSARNTILKLQNVAGMDFVCMCYQHLQNRFSLEDGFNFGLKIMKVNLELK